MTKERRTDLRADIYIPAELKDRMAILPRGTVSRVCREDIWKAVKEQEQIREEFIRSASEED